MKRLEARKNENQRKQCARSDPFFAKKKRLEKSLRFFQGD